MLTGRVQVCDMLSQLLQWLARLQLYYSFVVQFFIFQFVTMRNNITAVCNPACVNGECSAPNVCQCNKNTTGPTCAICAEGWTGKTCTTPICAAGCLGTCSEPMGCDCYPRWTGQLCNQCTVGWGSPNNNCAIGKPIRFINQS
jgi:hypothetical protein